MKVVFFGAVLALLGPVLACGQSLPQPAPFSPQQAEQIRRAAPPATGKLQEARFYEDGTVAVLTYYQQKDKLSRPYNYRQYTFYADGAPCSRVRTSSSGTQRARTWNQSGQLIEKRKATRAAQGTVIETVRRFAYQDGRLASIRITKEQQACYVIDLLASKTIEFTGRRRIVTTHKGRGTALNGALSGTAN